MGGDINCLVYKLGGIEIDTIDRGGGVQFGDKY